MLPILRPGSFLRHSFIVAPVLSLNGNLGRSLFLRLSPGWALFNYRNAPVVGGLAGGFAHLQSCQTFLTSPASTVLAEASRGAKIVALMALANLNGLPSLLFTLLP